MSQKEQVHPQGAILQRDGETYAIAPRLAPAGILDLATMKKLADVVERFNIPVVKMGSAQRIVLVGLKADQVEPVCEALGVEPAPADGPYVHYVIGCPGTVACRFGVQDSLSLAGELDKEFIGYSGLTHKFKIGVSGCPRCCSQSWVRDFGAFGTAKGWTVIVGGLAGGRPRIGDKLAEGVTAEEVKDLLRRTLDAYKKLGQGKERLGRTIDRVGFEAFKAAVLS